MKRKRRTWVVGWLAVFVMVSSLNAQEKTQRIERTDEKELKLKVEYAAGRLQFKKTTEDILCQLSARALQDDITPRVQYQKNGTTGFLSIGIMQDENLRLSDFGDQDWTLELTDKIPVSLNIELGASKSRFDFGGLRLRDVNLQLGASSSTVDFSSANRDRMNKLKIEAGVSKLTATGLCNANFERFEFEGGVGSYSLDFSGHLSDYSRARIAVGVGKIKIRIPTSTPFRITIDDNMFSSVAVSLDGSSVNVDRVYESDNLDEDSPFLDLKVEAGIGQIVVEIVR